MVKHIVLILLILFTGIYAEKPTIVWYSFSFPPYIITDGEDSATGLYDQTARIIQKHLPQYEHIQKSAPIARIIKNMEQNDNICSGFLLKLPEREKIACYSLPQAFIASAHFLITTADKKHLFDPFLDTNGTVSLEELLHHEPPFLFGRDNRSYGILDTIFNTVPRGKYYLVRSAPDHFGGLLSMMELGRLDFIVDYPSSIQYETQNRKLTKEFIAIPLREYNGKMNITLAYMLCSDSELGCQVINEVDSIIRFSRTTPEYRTAMEAWMTEDEIKWIRQTYDSLFVVPFP